MPAKNTILGLLCALLVLPACSNGSDSDGGSPTADSASGESTTEDGDTATLDTETSGASASSGTGTDLPGLEVCTEPDGDTADPGGSDPYRSCQHTACPQTGCCAQIAQYTACAPACETDEDCPGHPTGGLSCRAIFEGNYCVFSCDDLNDDSCPDEMVCGHDVNGRPVCLWDRF